MGTFEGWYEQTHPRVVSAITVIAGDAALASDATDEAFVRAYERWDRVSRMGSPSGWVYRTALNVVRRRARRSARERELLLTRGVDRQVPSDWSIELWDALERLPQRERTAIALRYVADLSGEQVAEVMGVKVGTVWSTLDAARRRLRESLDAGARQAEVVDE